MLCLKPPGIHIDAQNVKHFNPFPHKPWFLRVYSTSLLKTQWAKEKIPCNE